MSVDRVNTALRRVPAWVLYIVGPLPALWFLWLGLTGGLGIEPIRGLEHELGQFALKLMIAGLAITPLRRLAGLNLIRYRRAIGLLAFFYVLLHLAVWLFLDLQNWGLIRADILKRPYITIGMLAFALMIPLALTSNNRSVRKLGPSWRRLHRLTYPAVLLGAIHFVMLVKGWQAEPLIYLAVILGLLALRLRRAPRRAAA
ncbi:MULTISPECIES: protein-methionine-sulfoxide reductase heme-binding subunit MsrQ [Actibacterium]|uniref:Protein-methionine-sulfoxide reductase heme-binding subunit MsrQ n=1 Tax=Actibacterium naphthalenivorans TaxID=1614693 RepID=A0A840C7F4_9RHOB|nr:MULTISPECIES: protein-methionine-sulfoxide reductase heme-binding subunit MsrQ [Actibacterium]ALG91516.1 sulfite oxidase [Actibacterium sp. EMB200-NS6]MBB4021874.1 sulfoxide reductase heme-binding subunit YedZ [Actibacterium naphthalenivorans]